MIKITTDLEIADYQACISIIEKKNITYKTIRVSISVIAENTIIVQHFKRWKHYSQAFGNAHYEFNIRSDNFVR